MKMLRQLRAGNWFCSPDCRSIAAQIRARISAAPQPLPEPDYAWQLLRGKDGTHATTWALKAAQACYHACICPIWPLLSIITLKSLPTLLCLLCYKGSYTHIFTMEASAVWLGMRSLGILGCGFVCYPQAGVKADMSALDSVPHMLLLAQGLHALPPCNRTSWGSRSTRSRS